MGYRVGELRRKGEERRKNGTSRRHKIQYYTYHIASNFRLEQNTQMQEGRCPWFLWDARLRKRDKARDRKFVVDPSTSSLRLHRQGRTHQFSHSIQLSL